VVQALAYPLDKRFHRFISLEPSQFIFPDDRSTNYTIIEISMFEGRSFETKKLLIRLLYQYIEQEVGIAPQDVEVTIFETPKHCWGIRGQCADELTLNYKVDV
jgi:phenylpyruvate tautomerase PptA (4-oxalocrotonate tautomerase family)